VSVYVLILAALLALALWTVRRHWRSVAGLWRSACWWERCVLVLALAPLPGPFEEVAGLAVARRVAARIARDGTPSKQSPCATDPG